jgi:intergrase/recombinase
LIDWDVLMDDFWDWVDSRGLNPEYAEKIIRLLERFSPRIRGVRDVIRLFGGVSQGVRHNLVNAVRNLFNYCELIGYPKWWLDQLRRALPKDRVGVDLKVPSEGEILDSLSRLNRIPFSHQAFWLLLLDSGLRRCEAAWLINNRHEIREKFEFHGKFVCVWLGLFRRSKQAFYGYMTPQTYDLIMQVKGEVKPDTAGHYFSKFNFVTPKYLRKFVFDKMLELGVPESVADFIEGRVPKTVGARHYTKLKRQANHYYPKYAAYIQKLRKNKL